MTLHHPLYRGLSWFLSGVLILNPLLSSAAGLTVDKSGGGNTSLGQAGNGTPVVNIATPSAKGLSHNRFTNYNVGRQGLILNNSPTPVNSTIAGGAIQHNPNLTGGSAAVILNEVTGNNRSQLQGYTEVAGNPARVIVANPYGITCDGCGFINTPRVTLTTGKPIVEGGELTRYEVRQGDIRFEGQDVNLGNIDQFEIITRSAQLNAQLHAKQLTAILGVNDVDAQTLAATAQGGDTAKPQLALDSTALGGMYANAIRLIGTEAGVGVNMAGELAASAGDIRIDVGGQLTLVGAAAAQNLTLKAENIALTGNAQAGNTARLEATHALTVNQQLNASRIEILADQASNHGSLLTPGDLTLQANALDNRGTLGAGETLTLDAGNLANQAGALLFAGKGMDLHAQTFANHGNLLAAGDLSIQTHAFDNRNGSLVAQNHLSLKSDSLNNQSGAIFAGNLALSLTNPNWTNEGYLIASGDLSLQLASLDNRGILGAGETLILDAQGLTNQAGALLFAGGDMALYTRTLANRGDIQSGGNLLIAKNSVGDWADSLSNRSGTIQSGGSLAIFAQQIDNVRDVLEVATSQRAQLSPPHCGNSSDCGGTNLYYDYTLEETTRTEIKQASAPSWLIAGGDLTLISGQIKNDASVMAAANDIAILATTFENTGVLPGDTTLTRHLKGARIRNGSANEYAALTQYAAAFNAQYGSFSENSPSAEIGWFLNTFVGSWRGTANVMGQPVTVYGSGSHGDPGKVTILSTTFTPAANAAYYQGLVQAGGNITIAAQKIGQGAEQPGFGYVSEGTTSSGLPTPVHFNPQSLPDTTHALTDPLALAGLPTSALFTQAAPNHPWLLQANPITAQQTLALGSDYLLGLLGIVPDALHKRLGDGSLEQWLIRQGVLARTGQWLLTGYASEEAQYRALMDNAAGAAEALQLSLGVALTAEQMASLKTDIVWLVEKEIDGQTVLAPVLYLAQNPDRLAPNGAAIVAGNNLLVSGQELANAGLLKAQNITAVIDGQIANSGLMQSRETLALIAGSIENAKGGILAGQDILLQAEGDIVNQASLTAHDAKTPHGAIHTEFLDAPARIEAGNNLVIQAGGNLINRGSVIQAGGDASLEAGQNLIVESAQTRQQRDAEARKSSLHEQEITQTAAVVTAGGNLTLAAGDNLAVIGSQIAAAQDALLVANGQILIAAAANEQHRDFYRGGDKKEHRINDRVEQQSAQLSAGNNLTLVAGGDLTLVSSQLKAGNDATLMTGGDLNLLAANNEKYDFYFKKDKGFLHQKTKTDSVYDSQAVPNQIEAGNNLTLYSDGDQRYQRSQLIAGEQLALISGGDIRFEGTKDVHHEVHAKSNSNGLWQVNAEKGKIDETFRQNELRSRGQPIIEALGSISVQIKELPPAQKESLSQTLGRIAAADPAVAIDPARLDPKQLDQPTLTQAIDAMAAENPDLAWIKQLNDRGDINLEQVKEVHEAWSKRQEGLGPVGALIVAVVVAAITYGAASAMVGTAASATAGSGTAMATAGMGAAGTATAGMMVPAGWANMALASGLSGMAGSAAAQLGSNGRVDWNQVGKTGLIAVITAGILNYPAFAGNQSLNNLAGISAPTTETGALIKAQGGFSDGAEQIAAIAGRGLVTAGVGSLIQGSDFKDGLINSIVGDFAALTANQIGTNWGNGQNPALQTLAHGALGAAAAKLTGKDAAAGALGGITESLLDNTLQQSDWKIDSSLGYTSLSMLVGGVIAEAFGRDGITAAQAAQNAAVNNYLFSHEVEELVDKRRECGPDNQAACDRVKELLLLDKQRNLALATACSSGNAQECTNLRIEANKAQASLSTGRLDDLLHPGVWGDSEKQMAHRLMYAETDRLLLEAAGWTPEQIQREAGIMRLLSETVTGFTIGGDVRDFVNAKTWDDYLWVVLGIAPVVGDLAGVLRKAGKGVDAVKGGTTATTPGKTIVVDAKGNALVGEWSATKTLTSPENALAHWSKHAAEFPELKNASQYTESAQKFVSNPPANVLTKTRTNGDVLLYDTVSNTFAVKNSAGTPRTMFRPADGINYWNKQ